MVNYVIPFIIVDSQRKVNTKLCAFYSVLYYFRETLVGVGNLVALTSAEKKVIRTITGYSPDTVLPGILM